MIRMTPFPPNPLTTRTPRPARSFCRSVRLRAQRSGRDIHGLRRFGGISGRRQRARYPRARRVRMQRRAPPVPRHPRAPRVRMRRRAPASVQAPTGPPDSDASPDSGASPAAEAPAPSLGSASTFAVLGASTVTCANLSAVTGNVGVSPGTAITGFDPGCTITGTNSRGGRRRRSSASGSGHRVRSAECRRGVSTQP